MTYCITVGLTNNNDLLHNSRPNLYGMLYCTIYDIIHTCNCYYTASVDIIVTI